MSVRLNRPGLLMLAAFIAAMPLTLRPEAGAAFLGVSSACAKEGGENRGGGNSGSGSRHGGGGEDSRGHRSGRHGETINVRGDLIKVIYPDGFREELEDGVLELKDPSGRTVVKRRATADDIARLRRLAAP